MNIENNFTTKLDQDKIKYKHTHNHVKILLRKANQAETKNNSEKMQVTQINSGKKLSQSIPVQQIKIIISTDLK